MARWVGRALRSVLRAAFAQGLFQLELEFTFGLDVYGLVDGLVACPHVPIIRVRRDGAGVRSARGSGAARGRRRRPRSVSGRLAPCAVSGGAAAWRPVAGRGRARTGR